MYGCDNFVGCLTASASRATEPIVVQSRGITPMLFVTISSNDGIEVKANSVTPDVLVGINRLGERLNITCGIVCSTNDDFYIKVEQEAVWLTHGLYSWGEFNVESNVMWIIE